MGSIKKVIIISGVNLFEGGTLSIIKDCLSFVNKSEYNSSYEFIAIVHKKELYKVDEYNNIKFIEFPKSRKSYLYRLFYEYYYFKKIAKKYNTHFWLSLHDMTPNVGKIQQAVYCHNPSPFNSIKISDLIVQPTQFFFSIFYKYLYRINIKKNKFIIVQQLWMKNKFMEMFNLETEKIVIAKPQLPIVSYEHLNKNKKIKKTTFFFPTFPRPFKNIEIIGEAIKIINSNQILDFEVLITIDGSENRYSKKIVELYKSQPNIKFTGLLSREQVHKLYSETDCLIFPSKLETWGLPLSEFKQYDKPILVSNLPYSKETIGGYEKVCFFNENDPKELSDKMIEFIKSGKLKFHETNEILYPEPFVDSWVELFQKILN